MDTLIHLRILMEDLHTVYQQLSQGAQVQLPLKTTSFKEWSIKLAEFARTEALNDEIEYWRNVADNNISGLPVDFANGSNNEKDADVINVTLSEEETQSLLLDVPSVYGTEINDVLLTAVVLAFKRWTDSEKLLIDMEGHGREDLFEDVDISRTLGWFTSLYPVVLELQNGFHSGEALKEIKEQLHKIPQKGIGYGILRYLSENEELKNHLSSQAKPEVSFNYLGQFDQVFTDSMPFGAAKEPIGVERGLENHRTHSISINGSIIKGRLQMAWFYSRELYQSQTIEKLANSFIDALREIITHCQSPEAGGYTPFDFEDVDLDQGELDELMVELGEM